MKPKSSHFQVRNRENIQERVNQRRPSIPYHQPSPPSPPTQQAEIAARTSSAASNDLDQQDEAILIPNAFLLRFNPPGSPTLTLHLPSQSVRPSHETPRIYPHPDDQESSTDSPPRTALPTAPFSSTSLPVRMPQPTGNVPSPLPIQRPYCPCPRPLSPGPELLMLLQSSSPPNGTNQEDHEPILDLNTSLSPIPQTTPTANASSCPNKNTLRLPSQSILRSHATPRIIPHSQERQQERAISLPPKAAFPTARFSSTSRSVCMPLPADDVPSLLPQQRPKTVSESPPVTPPLSPRSQLHPNGVPPQLATRPRLLMLLQPPPPPPSPRSQLQPNRVPPQMATRPRLLMLVQPPPPPPSTPDAGSSISAFQNQPSEKDHEPIIAPYPWLTTRRATVHPIDILQSRDIHKIDGWMQCKYCKTTYKMHYNLQEKFLEVASFVTENKNRMGGMDPSFWEQPTLPNCNSCKKGHCVMPKVETKKRSINWLFLFLGQWIGCCSPGQLKYFYKHNGYSQEGSKPHLVYLTYIGIYQQLLREPNFHSKMTGSPAP